MGVGVVGMGVLYGVYCMACTKVYGVWRVDCIDVCPLGVPYCSKNIRAFCRWIGRCIGGVEKQNRNYALANMTSNSTGNVYLAFSTW